MLSNEVFKVCEHTFMEDFLNLTYDPFICSFCVSLVLTIGLAYICNRFTVNAYSYITTRPSSNIIKSEYQWNANRKKSQHPILLWIMKCVRRKESPGEDPDHHISAVFN